MLSSSLNTLFDGHNWPQAQVQQNNNCDRAKGKTGAWSPAISHVLGDRQR